MSSFIAQIKTALIDSYSVINYWDGCAWIEHQDDSCFTWDSIPDDDYWGEKEGERLYMGCVFCGSPVSSGHFATCKFERAKQSLRNVV